MYLGRYLIQLQSQRQPQQRIPLMTLPRSHYLVEILPSYLLNMKLECFQIVKSALGTSALISAQLLAQWLQVVPTEL